jgi:hypothetical protein
LEPPLACRVRPNATPPPRFVTIPLSMRVAGQRYPNRQTIFRVVGFNVVERWARAKDAFS